MPCPYGGIFRLPNCGIDADDCAVIQIHRHQTINLLRNTHGIPVWQRNYYERIIRDDWGLATLRESIVAKPARWAGDENHPARL